MGPGVLWPLWLMWSLWPLWPPDSSRWAVSSWAEHATETRGQRGLLTKVRAHLSLESTRQSTFPPPHFQERGVGQSTPWHMLRRPHETGAHAVTHAPPTARAPSRMDCAPHPTARVILSLGARPHQTARVTSGRRVGGGGVCRWSGGSGAGPPPPRSAGGCSADTAAATGTAFALRSTVLPLPLRLRHRLCRVPPAAVEAEALPLPLCFRCRRG